MAQGTVQGVGAADPFGREGRSLGTTTMARSCQPPSPPWQPTRLSKAAAFGRQ